LLRAGIKGAGAGISTQEYMRGFLFQISSAEQGDPNKAVMTDRDEKP